jgi:diacylglycerol kinase family enzyme
MPYSGTYAALKVIFVVNPIAGGTDKTAFLQYLNDYCAEHGLLKTLFLTTGINDHEALQSLFGHIAPDMVVAVGGDGTCNLVAGVLMGTGVPLGIIPYGSANGMSLELQIPENPREALHNLRSGLPKTLDMLWVNQSYHCLRICDLGINARIIRRFARSKTRGLRNYFKLFIEEVYRSRPLKVTFHFPGGTLRKKAHMVAFANARKYGSGAMINPFGRMDDGIFEVCMIKQISLKGFFITLKHWLMGKPGGNEYMEIVRCRSVMATFKRPKTMQIDGELIGKVDRVEISIRPGAIQVIVPRQSAVWQTEEPVSIIKPFWIRMKSMVANVAGALQPSRSKPLNV